MSTTTTDPIPMNVRHAELGDLKAILDLQHDLKSDHVITASRLRSTGGLIYADPVNPDGAPLGPWRPMSIFDGDVAAKLGIPSKYLNRMRESATDLYDANLNGWLRGYETVGPFDGNPARAGDSRRFLVRTFNSPDPMGEGIARSLLSDTFGRFDHLDVLTAALMAIRDLGLGVDIYDCDLTERRMRVRIAAPGVEMLAPDLLDGYRTPWSGKAPDWQELRRRFGNHHIFKRGEEPIVFAGIELGNSETGDGQAFVCPSITVARCTNGLLMTEDMVGRTHLGQRLPEGTVHWSDDTQRKNVDLVVAMVKDAVTTFLTPEYLSDAVERVKAKAGIPIDDKRQEVIQAVGKELHFSDDVTRSVFEHFLAGGQYTTGGVMQAITSVSQTLSDADLAYEMDLLAVEAMDVAARAVARA